MSLLANTQPPRALAFNLSERINQDGSRAFIKNSSHRAISDPETFLCPILDNILLFCVTYYQPCIIFTGLVGNFSSCVVFLTTHLKKRSSNFYLAALAVVDSGFLLSLLLTSSYKYFGVDLYNKKGWCQAVVYLSLFSGILSVRLIVAFTFERFMAVVYPLRCHIVCSVRRAKIIVFSLTCFSLVENIYPFVMFGIVETSKGVFECRPSRANREQVTVMVAMDSMPMLFVPLVCIVVMNAIIARNLMMRRGNFSNTPRSGDTSTRCSDFTLSQLSPSSSSQASTSLGSNRNAVLEKETKADSKVSENEKENSRAPDASSSSTSTSALPQSSVHVQFSNADPMSAKTQRKITKMLLLVSTVFIILNLPSFGLRFFVYVLFPEWRESWPKTLNTIHLLFMQLFYTHFSVNFLLYSMCATEFRRCFWQMIRKVCQKLSRLYGKLLSE